jgi:hypothetical protein
VVGAVVGVHTGKSEAGGVGGVGDGGGVALPRVKFCVQCGGSHGNRSFNMVTAWRHHNACKQQQCRG